MTYNVILGATCGRISGVDTFSVDLARGLRGLGISAHILLTDALGDVPDALPLPDDVPVEQLRVGMRASWPRRWQAMIDYLEACAPCIYIPNYDWAHSCVAPRLSAQVAVVGIVHSDDPAHYDHVDRVGAYWNAVVAVSGAIAQEVTVRHPTLAGRLVTVPYGVAAGPALPTRRDESGSPLRVLYAGRLAQHQKRVLDLPAIVTAALSRGVPIELTIIGSGADAGALRAASGPLIERGSIRLLGTLARTEVLRQCAESDVFLLTSAFEGLPLSLLEAMGQGCVPVVSDIRSGIPELIQHGRTGFRVPVGDVEGFAAHLAQLHRDSELRRSMSAAAFAAVVDGGYTADTMSGRYVDVFDRVWRAVADGTYLRPAGPILPPAWMRPTWKYYVPWTIRRFAEPMYRMLHGELAPTP